MTIRRKAGAGYRVQCDGPHIEGDPPKAVTVATSYLGEPQEARKQASAEGWSRVGMKLDYCPACTTRSAA